MTTDIFCVCVCVCQRVALSFTLGGTSVCGVSQSYRGEAATIIVWIRLVTSNSNQSKNLTLKLSSFFHHLAGQELTTLNVLASNMFCSAALRININDSIFLLTLVDWKFLLPKGAAMKRMMQFLHELEKKNFIKYLISKYI